MHLDGLGSCAELTTENAEEAARSSTAMAVLLAWATKTARPGGGAPKILMAIARLARAEWVEGTPYVEIAGDESETLLSVFSDHGMGIRERLLPQTRMRVPVDEFTRAVRLAPQLIAPFRSVQRGTTLVLAPPEMSLEDARESIMIAESSLSFPEARRPRSLHEQARQTVPPPTIKAPQRELKSPKGPADPGVHTHPTVRRMVVVRPEALRREKGEGRKD